MADEKEKEEEQKPAPADHGSNKLILIIIVVLLLFLLIIGGVVTYFLLSGGENPEDKPDQPKQEEKKVEQKVQKDAAEIGPIYPLDPFVVNLKSSGATRYLKCTINLEIDSPDTQPELDKMKPLMRDIIIRILSSKTVAEISTAKGKEKLKAEIKKNLNAKLATGEIRNVYFTAFVIQ
ncbi:MAG: flagellar basal body-associated protein FliL [Epsilonproteobacteria bacterium]|nr:flagellar basal body-associated protein FliL [Campylobacterota bacterium]